MTNLYLSVCTYKHPSSDLYYINCITDSLDNLRKNFPANKLIIAGDFNLPHIDGLYLNLQLMII